MLVMRDFVLLVQPKHVSGDSCTPAKCYYIIIYSVFTGHGVVLRDAKSNFGPDGLSVLSYAFLCRRSIGLYSIVNQYSLLLGTCRQTCSFTAGAGPLPLAMTVVKQSI